MTPDHILSAIRLGEATLNKQHGAVTLLWRKFGAEIKARRAARNMSQAQLGKHLGYSGQMVALLEKGSRIWPMKKAERAVAVLTRPVQWPDAATAGDK
jgi:DNA-binding XRE family transcriptional regulator